MQTDVRTDNEANSRFSQFFASATGVCISTIVIYNPQAYKSAYPSGREV